MGFGHNRTLIIVTIYGTSVAHYFWDYYADTLAIV